MFIRRGNNDRRFHKRFAHRPINHSIIIIIGEALLIKLSLIALPSYVLNKHHKEILVNSVPHDILMRPFGHGLGKGPFCGINEIPQCPW